MRQTSKGCRDMLKGIDISSWQSNLNISNIADEIDFCIVKATEGIGYTDPSCESFVQGCIENGLLWGFYHFARENDPCAEAEYFYNECRGYIGHGVPVLDYETENIDNADWCENFCQAFFELSGVWPVIYISASRIPEYSDSWLPEKCGLWIAGYPYAAKVYTYDVMPYDIGAWNFCALWQFTSSLRLWGYGADLDGNFAYMDADAWQKYADVPETTDIDTPNNKTCEQLADEVIAGKWGNDWNRKNALDSAYGKGTYAHVQCIVNQKLGLDGC